MNSSRKPSRLTRTFGLFLLGVAVISPFQSWREVPWYFSVGFGVIGLLLFFSHEKKVVPEKKEEPLFPWELRALEEAKEKRFSAFSELYFSYRFLEDPRNQIIAQAFKELIRADPEILEAFRSYCKWHRYGGTQGGVNWKN